MNWARTTLADQSEREDFARLVAERYEQEFGDRLTIEQILEPHHPSKILVEYDQDHRIVAGVKLSSLAGSFSADCIGKEKLKSILGEIPVDEIVEVSKVVNVGTMLSGSRLIGRTYNWLKEHARYGFVAVGPSKKVRLYRWLLAGSWHKPWNVCEYSIDQPQVELPEHIQLSMMWAKPKPIVERSGAPFAKCAR